MAPRARRLARLGRLLAWTSLTGLALGAGTLAACASTSTSDTTGGGDEAGSDASALADGSVADDDGAATTTDAGDGGAPVIVDGPGEAGAECAFNRDCHAALRCECTEATGCACKPGARGTGQNGVTPCSDGNACASSVCTEGPPDSGSFCSDECKTSADCKGKLPLCSDIAFVGRICIRQPP
jgi:hypothetical protein